MRGNELIISVSDTHQVSGVCGRPPSIATISVSRTVFNEPPDRVHAHRVSASLHCHYIVVFVVFREHSIVRGGSINLLLPDGAASAVGKGGYYVIDPSGDLTESNKKLEPLLAGEFWEGRSGESQSSIALVHVASQALIPRLKK